MAFHIWEIFGTGCNWWETDRLLDELDVGISRLTFVVGKIPDFCGAC